MSEAAKATDESISEDQRISAALAAVGHTLDKFRGSNEIERQRLRLDLQQLERMHAKLTTGRIDMVVFGEISTGKSALINAIVGEAIAAVDVRGGWTREVWHVPWDGAGYCVAGLGDSQVVLVDTPGLNEVGGDARGDLAKETAQQADLILFVTDSDLNEIEFAALESLAKLGKPILVVLNKLDLYTPSERERLIEVIRDERLSGIVPAENFVTTSAAPREMEFVIEAANGSSHSEWRQPEPDVTRLKAQILKILEHDGQALLALNAAMYAADKSDRVAAIRIEIRTAQATKTIGSYAVVKAVAVAANAVPGVDVAAGGAVDVAMVLTLAHIYGLEMNWAHARNLVLTIGRSAGWMAASEAATHVVCWTCKALTFGWGTFATAIPQGAVAGYGSYIVGNAARYYFEHGASWGGEAPKKVVTRILEQTDKQSVIENLKTEIKTRLFQNRHAK